MTGSMGGKVILGLAVLLMAGAASGEGAPVAIATAIQPKVITEPVPHDSDDPAIWINRTDPLKSLVLGTDKNSDGGLFAFNLDGKIVAQARGLQRPNNVDVLTGFRLGGETMDIAVVTEREMQRLRVFRLPDLTPLDRGDLVVFDGDKERAPMGIALYQRPRDHVAFAIVGGKTGPKEGYLWQYRLEDDGAGMIRMSLVRKFGSFTGEKEIESIAVDASVGSVYYSDESYGVREYAADPDSKDADRELSVSGREGFAKDREGISIYPLTEKAGYLVVSDQGANSFRIFRRESPEGELRQHEFLKAVQVAAVDSDGSDVTAVPLGPKFPSGLFVAMSADRTYHFYSWGDMAGGDLGPAAGNPTPGEGK